MDSGNLNKIKQTNKKVGLHQTKNVHGKGSHQQNEKQPTEKEKKICKLCMIKG